MALAKNITFTDHPYNDMDNILAKQNDPKDGYNTTEKLANSTAPKELPAVTSDDNNKVLVVSDGEWVAGSAPSSGVVGNMLLTFTLDETTNYMVCDHTWQEIHDAYVSGASIIIVNIENDGDVISQDVISEISKPHEEQSTYAISVGGLYSITCETANDYPSYEI